ncbi:DUF2267 domain-containing protein [Anabaena sp. PCC 7108]|uniref:DUF2267 domain-containing protein n=1 Tax=Anabaena sp. PCC 7108 TaxID=163908 RepID=UPI000346CF57|nr:DUF2267 domain-containing protein [Anabaena sp. PCC 7108]
MEYTEFITHVQSLTQSNSREEAELATHATLATIKELIPNDEVQKLAEQLPEVLGQYLRERETEANQSFHLQEFIERASKKENIDPTIGAIHVRAVFAVIQNAITPENFLKLHTFFSHDYEELFAI